MPLDNPALTIRRRANCKTSRHPDSTVFKIPSLFFRATISFSQFSNSWKLMTWKPFLARSRRLSSSTRSETIKLFLPAIKRRKISCICWGYGTDSEYQLKWIKIQHLCAVLWVKMLSHSNSGIVYSLICSLSSSCDHRFGMLKFVIMISCLSSINELLCCYKLPFSSVDAKPFLMCEVKKASHRNSIINYCARFECYHNRTCYSQ